MRKAKREISGIPVGPTHGAYTHNCVNKYEEYIRRVHPKAVIERRVKCTQLVEK